MSSSVIDEYGLAEIPEPDVNGEPVDTRAKLTLRTPDELLAMHFDDSDVILGDRMLALAQSADITGQGGLGKSRFVVQMAACQRTGRKFLTFDTYQPDLRWLFLQTENTNRRLHQDLAPIRRLLGDDWSQFQKGVVFHTIENDQDGFVSLDNAANQAAISEAIRESRADIVVADPLNDFAIGDLNKDADMKMTLTAFARLVRKGNPNRVPLVLHHALTGRAGAAKATGFDRSSFSRNSKVLFNWTRAQINLAPVDGDTNERMIVACGKCSNGREFAPFGIRLNPETKIYECDPTVDVAAWANDVAGNRGVLMSNDRVRELCKPLSSKAELAKAIMDDCGCYRGSAYRYIARAQTSKRIGFNKTSETYSPK